MSNEYLDNLINELSLQGIEPPKTNNNITNNNDREMNIILDIERITGRKFSDEQRRILEHHGNACILACAGSGKALVNGTGVLTPVGYVPIEKLNVGDKVYDECGCLQSVTGVFPQGKKKVYEVKFSDDTVIKCCKDHLWAYQTYNMRRTHKRFDVKTTEYIKDKVQISVYPFEHKTKGKQNRANIYIPMCEAVQFDKKELPLKPYLLGALLGDGCIRNSEVNCGFSFTNEDADVVNRVNSELNEIGAYLKLSEGCTYRINTTRDNKLTPILRELGLLNTSSHNKCIPNIYKLSSVEDRLELLKGLIDTDGTCNGTSYEITLASEQLIDDIQFIVETLGMTATKSSKKAICYKENNESVDCGEVYRLYIKTSDSINKIHYSEHRESQWKSGQTSARRTIVEIRETEEEAEMTCIKVSGLSELFLTEHCVVTHNTTVSVNLIAKRILTGEIRDVNKLIYTTFSKSGANEMKERLDLLLKQLGMGHVNVQVRTLHSFFLSILKTFGINKKIITSSERSRMIKQACSEANFILKDDDLMIVDNLISYQVNNLLTNRKLVDSYVNTLENLTVDIFKNIVTSYRNQKAKAGCIDYDDMQYYLWMWLVKYDKSDDANLVQLSHSVRDYCKAMFTDFYIDEAQDISKIQFEIIRAMVEDPNNPNKLDRGLVFIGDDDQCLHGDTYVTTPYGEVKIKDLKYGDKVLSVNNNEIIESTVLEVIKHKNNKNDIYLKINTAHGNKIVCTSDHKLLVNNCSIDSSKKIKEENGYYIIRAIDATSGMGIDILENNSIIHSTIESVELIDSVNDSYDINLSIGHNFFANGMLVHNCIYEWRGSDPNIILSIGATFNMQTFILSTNYRCLNEIVDYAANGIKYNNKRFSKSMNAFTEGGNVKIYPSTKEDLCCLSIVAMDQIKEWLKNGDKASDIAVLSRNNFHLALLSNMLLREGIYCDISEDMKLTKSYMYSDIKNIIDITETTWKPDLTSKVLWKLCRFMGVNNARIISKFQDNSALSMEDALGWILKKFVFKDLDFNKKINISLQVENQMMYQIGKLQRDTLDDMLLLYDALKLDDRAERIKKLLNQYLYASGFMYKSKDKNRSIYGLVKYINNLMLKDGVDNMINFLRVTEQLEHGTMVIPGEKITLTTIHSAKGREWKNVIMFACDNVSQPSLDSIANMVDEGISVSDIFENIDEERRLFYVGNTRAKENLLVITYSKPSVFILEALGAFSDRNTGNNDNILQIALDENLINKYSDTINDKILNTNSKYYYEYKGAI